MVSVGRILRDYRDAGSVNGLLALWGFVDETTFLTKAGHVGVVFRVRGVDYEGVSHPQRQALTHRFEAALRLLDDRCRVYQYLLKRSVAPFVAAPCPQPIANEAIQRRAAYLNERRHDLYDLSLYLVLLYEAPHVVRKSTELRGVCRAPGDALRAWLSPDHALRLLESELDRAIGGGLWKGGDQRAIDGLMVNGSARVVGWFSGVVRLLQSGLIYWYAFVMLFGVLLALSWFLFLSHRL